ncbi:MAG: 2-phospho-L-lactate guanylyltransferase [Acidobacteria bacterium]|nr:2-phospho-L-lactate guanylyltransferase [Acidobacteriota bacterium]
MKPLAQAKARLAPALSPEGRRILALAMLADVLPGASGAGRVWVLNSDEEAAEIASRAGAEPRDDPAPGAGLNASLEAATTDAIAAGASGVLVLAADVPLVTAEEVRAVAGGPGVAVAPSLDGQGTNALWRSPPRAIPAAFGGASRPVHEALARARRLEFRTVDLPGLGLDVDRPEDLERLLSLTGGAPETRAALERLGFRQAPAAQIPGDRRSRSPAEMTEPAPAGYPRLRR